MDRTSGQRRAVPHLYPPIDPFDQQMLNVGDGHHIYVEQCGRPDGVPVIVVHGGPGGGCSPAMRRYFDPEVYRIILFDQRGCGRSTPSACVDHNTTWHLVADMEVIRERLDIDSWYTFGGSWGATLSLIYAQTHPENVRGIVLRGVFLMTQPELDWFYGGGVGGFWPDLWDNFAGMVPEGERHDLIGAYHKRLFGGDSVVEAKFARAWTLWENALASIESNGFSGEVPAYFARMFARLENHYFINNGFLTEETAILNNMDKLQGIDGFIVQGRYDMICPPQSAYRLHKSWKGSRLRMIPHAGHALSEPGITRELVRTMDDIAAHQ